MTCAKKNTILSQVLCYDLVKKNIADTEVSGFGMSKTRMCFTHINMETPV